MTDINQAAVLAGGVTPGDTPGFPARISVPGSYRLTSNLEVPANVVHAIEIVTSHVTIDLNGFVISRKKPDLPPAIFGAAARVNFVKICNGHIHDSGGVDLRGIGNRVESMQLEGPDPNPSATGIVLGDMGVAMNNQVSKVDNAFIVGTNGIVKGNATFNVGHGTRTGQNSIVEGNTFAGGAAQSSIRVGDGSIVSGNIAGPNDAGIEADKYCLIRENTVRNNNDFGIGGGDGCVITGNRVNATSHGPGITTGVGSTVEGNAVSGCGLGIQSTDGTLMNANAVSKCTGFGLKMAASSGYTDNVLNANNAGAAQVSGGLQIEKNECNGAFCP